MLPRLSISKGHESKQKTSLSNATGRNAAEYNDYVLCLVCMLGNHMLPQQYNTWTTSALTKMMAF